MMKDFYIKLEPLDKEALHEHCLKFFDALDRMEGSIPLVAEFLKNELLEKTADEFPKHEF